MKTRCPILGTGRFTSKGLRQLYTILDGLSPDKYSPHRLEGKHNLTPRWRLFLLLSRLRPAGAKREAGAQSYF
jgi:hypothetical protein